MYLNNIKLLALISAIGTVSLPAPTYAGLLNSAEFYCDSLGDRSEGCGLMAALMTIVPTLWPSLTIMPISALTEKLTTMMSSLEKQQLAMAQVEASEVLTNFDIDTNTVKGQILSPNFLAVKANLEAHLSEMDWSELGLNDNVKIENLNNAQAAFLMLALNPK